MTDIIANILLREIGSTPKVQPVTPSTGLGAMTSRKGITAPQEEQQADPTQNIQRPIIDIYRKIVQQEIGDGSGLTGDKIPYDPLVDTPETLAARGYNPDEVLRNSVFSSTISGTKGRTPKDKVLTDIEDLIQSYEDKRAAKKSYISKERATASSSILDVLQAELMRGMTSKQTDTQPTVSADSSRDRFELQGDMRDLPVLDDEGAPEVDARSNEMLDKELPSDGLGSRPVAEAQTAPISGGEIREPDFEPPKEEVKEVLFIQKGLTDLGFKPGGVDGAVGGGTRRALRKFQKANGLEITGIMTPEVFTLIRSGEAVKYPDPPKPDAKVSKILDSNFEVFKEAVAQKESSGRYNIMGGYNNHYVGRYQMGKDALEDEGYSYKKRDALLKDPKKQDELFKKFTLRNHKKLTQNSKKYRDMSEKEKLGVLGYAHNQGATAAAEWLYTGVSGKDANGTLGDEYTSLIARYFSLASKRPRARPDTRVASN